MLVNTHTHRHTHRHTHTLNEGKSKVEKDTEKDSQRRKLLEEGNSIDSDRRQKLRAKSATAELTEQVSPDRIGAIEEGSVDVSWNGSGWGGKWGSSVKLPETNDTGKRNHKQTIQTR